MNPLVKRNEQNNLVIFKKKNWTEMKEPKRKTENEKKKHENVKWHREVKMLELMKMITQKAL